MLKITDGFKVVNLNSVLEVQTFLDTVPEPLNWNFIEQMEN